MNRMKKELLLVLAALAIVSCGNGRQQRETNHGDGSEERQTVTIASLVRQLSDEELQGVKTKGLSNAEKWMILSNLTYEVIRRSQLPQAAIRDSLTGVALDRYNAERKAFIAWHSYQRKELDGAISNLWKLFVGGSAGASVASRNDFDIACINLADQQLLAGSLANGEKPDSCSVSATFRQIDSARIELFDQIQFCIETPGIAEGMGVDVTEMKKIKDLLDADYRLFKDWMTKRAVLSSTLGEPARSVLSSNTKYWMYYYCERCRHRFI